MNISQLETFNFFVSVIVASIALIVSIIALVFTVKTYLLKTGAYIRGMYTTTSTISCEEEYIKNIYLENLKDRAVIIFKIFLKIGHNYFVEIDDFEESPITLQPFEIFRKEYEPIEFYSTGTKKILLGDLLQDRSIRKQIVLSTSEGKYTVKDFIHYWDPIENFFKNLATAIIRPIRSNYKGKSYGSNAKYIIEFKMGNGEEEVIPIYARDYESRKFSNFNLTKESLVSKEALEEYLNIKITEGLLKCASIYVFDIEKWRNDNYKDEINQTITAKYFNWFEYYIIARIETAINEYYLNKRNRAIKKRK